MGPLIIASLIGGAKSYTLGYTVIAGIALVSIVLTVVTKIPRTRPDDREVPGSESEAPGPGELAPAGRET